MGYVDGFVVPVPKKNLQAYRRLARKAGKIGGSMGRWSSASVSPMT